MKYIALIAIGLFALTSDVFAQHSQMEIQTTHSAEYDGPRNLNAIFQIPTGVNYVEIHVWGAGGSGGPHGGGQAGGFIDAIVFVQGLAQISIVMGDPGQGTTIEQRSTSVGFGSPAIVYTAQGGADDGNTNGGGYSVPNDAKRFGWGFPGQTGEQIHNVAFTVLDSVHIIRTIKGGKGGNSWQGVDTHGYGCLSVTEYNPKQTLPSSVVINDILATNGICPGGGGGGGCTYPNGSAIVTVPGGAGGEGKVIIYY